MQFFILFFAAFSLTVADPATEDTSDFIFPTGSQTLGSDNLWDDPDVDLGLATDGLSLRIAGEDSLGLFYEGPYNEYPSQEDDDLFASAMTDNNWSGSGFESDCSLNQDSAIGKVRRENQCPGKNSEQHIDPSENFTFEPNFRSHRSSSRY